MTLVIMAAGMGSRFGGLKQIESVGPNGEFIIDYSIYDAIKAGFNKVVFIIKEENYDVFRNTIGKRIEGKIEVNYVFQNNDNVPIDLPVERVKPLGTGHAILCCKNVVDEPFAIINADDFYGREAYESAMNFINNNNDEKNYGLVSYKVGNTLTNYGTVKRGVCEVNGTNLIGLIESKIIQKDSKLYAEPLDGSESFEITFDTCTSMNLFVFYPSVFNYLDADFNEFLNNSKDLMTDEYMLPTVICNHLKKHDITCQLVENDSKWMGMTYREDLDDLKKYIEEEVSREIYPYNLYE